MARKGRSSRNQESKRYVIITADGKPHFHLGRIAVFLDEQKAIKFAKGNVKGYIRVANAEEIK